MSKFNEKNTMQTTNISGHKAYKMNVIEHLTTVVMTSLVGEPKFYGDTTYKLLELATGVAKTNPEYLVKLAAYVRNVENLRSVSHLLVAIIAHEAHEYTRIAIRNVVVRVDDITEIIAVYLELYKKPFPNALKREIANVMQNFDEYQYAKYDKANMSVKLKDVLRIVHPKPKDHNTEVLFGKILSNTLETPYTWETELSAKGNTKEVWEELIASNKVGYMALLRNLRNIIKSGADATSVLERISNEEEVKKSKQLPFRFFSAYKTLYNEGFMSRKVNDALEKAIRVSLGNVNTFKGRTLIAVDVSGSMTTNFSAYSDVTYVEIGILLGIMSATICEDATVCYFSMPGYFSKFGDKGYEIKKYGKFDPILSTVTSYTNSGGGTDLTLPIEYALKEDKSIVPFDRIIYFSDNECNSVTRREAVQKYVNEYREKFNPNLWVHAIDMEGYGTQQFFGPKFNLIAGWGDNIFKFIDLAESGVGNLITEIRNYELK